MAISTQAVRLSIIGVVIVSVVGFKLISQNSVEKKLDAMVERSHGKWSYQDASVDILGGDIHVNGISVKDGKNQIEIKEVVVHSYDKSSKVPQYMDLEVNGIDVNKKVISQNPQLSQLLDGLGYDKLEADLALNYSVDKAKKVLELKEFSFAVKDAGELKINADIYGIDDLRKLVYLIMKPQNTELGAASVSYKESSLIHRIIAADAKKSGITFDEAKKKILQNIQVNIERYKEKKELQKVEMLEKIYTFMENPKQIEISIDPTTPLAISKIASLSDKELKEKLALQVSVN